MKSKWLVLALTAAVAVCVTSAAPAQEKNKEATLRTLPGYVDFGTLDGLGEEARVEVSLRDPMLGLVSKFIGEDEPELRSLLASLKLVRVRVYAITPQSKPRLLDAGSRTARTLDSQGWERVVRVREEEDNVDVYFKPSTKAEWIDGVLVIAFGEDDEAVFVNIVGTIKPEDISRLSEHMDIDGLDRVRVETRTRN